MKIGIILAALLCGCTPQPNSESANQGEFGTMGGPPDAAANEMAAIERRCLAESLRNPNAMSCDWSTLEEARQWKPARRAPR